MKKKLLIGFSATSYAARYFIKTPIIKKKDTLEKVGYVG
ncbi:hypothetical protein NEOC65_000325 [Neochlamydia sp. AcF65]|nr:hypothetical protein [Neochlamydia sp. AcF65]